MTAMHDVGAQPQGAPATPTGDPSAGIAIGERLRQAREATGLTRDEFARRAHIPAGVLSDLEAGRLDRLGAGVFVRGYLRSFLRAAGLPESEFAGLLPALGDTPPPLVAQRVAPATPRWVTRYATPVAYALLTAVVMVPLVYLARPGAQQVAQVPSLTPIDATGRAAALSHAAEPVAAAAVPVAAGPDTGAVVPVPAEPQPAARAPAAASPAPVMASLAPLPQVAAPAGASRVNLRLMGDSWVEFTAANGARLEYALLPAGTVRDYDLQGSAVLMIGNASAARLTVDGRAVDLGPLSSENDVARVRLGDDPAPASD